MTDLHAPMQPAKLQNNSTRGAEAYKADYRKKLQGWSRAAVSTRPGA